MANISKIKTPDGTSYDINDATKVLKTGDTMTGKLIVPKTRIANTCYGVSFGRTTSTPVETILYTGIKWLSGTHMPVVHLTGYAFGLQSPVELKIGFYIYSDKIGWCGVTNMGAWKPDVYLFKYTRDSVNYVAIGFAGSCYYLQLQADVQDEMNKFKYISMDDANWSWEFLETTGTIPTPDDGVTCIHVLYKADILYPAKTDFVCNLGNLSSLGGGTPASAAKAYWENNIDNLSHQIAYNNVGSEYTILFNRGTTGNYGTILKWGYEDRYLRILRKNASNWIDSDWVKINAGYADSAESATSATTATKLGSSNVGSATQPIYLNGGTPTATTYTLGKSVPSDAVFTDNNTTYTIGASGNNVTLTPSSGSTQSITVPYATNAGKVNNHTVNKDVPSDAVFTDNNTTYTFAEGTTNGAFKVTPSGGTAQSVPVHGVLTSHQSVTDNNPTLSWGTKSKVATIGSTDINVTMPSNPASGKQDTITGAATTVTSSNLTASRVLISNTSGKISAASGVTTTEVGYLAGLDRKVMGFYSHKSYDYDISNDNMRGTSGQYEKNGSYWIKVEDWLGTMPPSGSYGTLEVMGNLQRFTVYSSNGSSTVYTRTYANSTWSDWKRIGSGVDASVSGTTLTLSSV